MSKKRSLLQDVDTSTSESNPRSKSEPFDNIAKPSIEHNIEQYENQYYDEKTGATIIYSNNSKNEPRAEYEAPGVVYIYLRFHRQCRFHYIPIEQRNYEGIQFIFNLPDKWWDPNVVSMEQLQSMLPNAPTFDVEKRIQIHNNFVKNLPPVEHKKHKLVGFVTEEISGKYCPQCKPSLDIEYIEFFGTTDIMEDPKLNQEYNDYCLSRSTNFEENRYYDPTGIQSWDDLANNYGQLTRKENRPTHHKNNFERNVDDYIHQFEQKRLENPQLTLDEFKSQYLQMVSN